MDPPPLEETATPSELRGAITSALREVEAGDDDGWGRLMDLSYPELRRIARRHLRRGRPGGTLATTGLVHEAWLKLVDHERASYQDRQHFFAVMSRAMRQVVVDWARRRSADKRGGGLAPIELDEERIPPPDQAAWLLEVDEALKRLQEVDERLVRVVECRFFSGFTEAETAEVLGSSVRTVQRDWKRARAWLKHELGR